MRTALYIILLSSFLITVPRAGDWKEVPRWLRLEQARAYKVIIAEDTTSNYYERDRKYYLVRMLEGGSRRDHEVIDSIVARQILACDTNAFVCTTIGDSLTHLIRVTLLPSVRHDTLVSIANDAPDNWLQNTYIHNFSNPYSTLLRAFWGNKGESIVEIVRMMPTNRWEVLRVLRSFSGGHMSHDFSQFFFVTYESADSSNLEAGLVLVYDLATDSLTIHREFGTSNISADRRSRSSPLICLKEIDSVRNIWACSPGGESRQLTFLEYPMSVQIYLYFIEPDYMMYIPVNLSNPDAHYNQRRVKE